MSEQLPLLFSYLCPLDDASLIVSISVPARANLQRMGRISLHERGGQKLFCAPHSAATSA